MEQWFRRTTLGRSLLRSSPALCVHGRGTRFGRRASVLMGGTTGGQSIGGVEEDGEGGIVLRGFAEFGFVRRAVRLLRRFLVLRR